MLINFCIIIAYAIVLYIISKILKLNENSFFTSMKVAFIQGGIMYFLIQLPYMKFLGFIIILALIKYFYKVDLKKAVLMWLFSLIIIPILIVAEMFYRGLLQQAPIVKQQSEDIIKEQVLEQEYSKLENYWQYIPHISIGNGAFLYDITMQKENVDLFREIKTTKGTEKVSVIYGARVIYRYKDFSDESIKIHVEKSDKDEFVNDKNKVIDQFRYFIKTDKLRDDGENANLKKYNGYEYIYIENTNLSHSPINMAVIFFPEDQIIETIYFLNKQSNKVKLQTIKDLIDFKINFKK